MRRLSATRIGLAGLVLGILVATAPAGAQVTLNGQQVLYSQPPFTIGSFLMLPLTETLRFVGGAAPTFNPETGEARFGFGDNDVLIRNGSGYAVVNGESVVMGVPAVIRNGSLYVPAIFLRQQVGITVNVSPDYVSPGVRALVLGTREPAVTIYEAGEIAVGGVRLLNLTTPGPFGSVEERNNVTTERMNVGIQRALQLDNGQFRVARISLAMMDGMPTIFIAGVPFLSVTAEDAEAAGVDQMSLAQEWTNRVRAGLRQVFAV